MKLCDRIRTLRKARGLSQQGLGELLSTNEYGVSRQAVSEWEIGNSVPKLENIKEIARALDVSIEDLLDDDIDLDNKETLLAVLHRDYKKEVGASFYKHFDIKRSYGWIIVLVTILFGAALSYLIYYVLKKQPSEEIPSTIMDRLAALKSEMDGLYACLFALASSIPVAFLFGTLINKFPTTQNVGSLSPRCLLLSHSSRYIPIQQIVEIKRCFLFTVFVLKDGTKIHLFAIRNPKGLISAFHDIKAFYK